MQNKTGDGDFQGDLEDGFSDFSSNDMLPFEPQAGLVLVWFNPSLLRLKVPSRRVGCCLPIAWMVSNGVSTNK